MTHILLSNAAVGSIINVPVNGTIREFILVHNGNPDSSIYDSSCNGVWLLAKECCKEDSWGSDQNIYETSSIHQYLNGDFFAGIDSKIQAHVKTVKIPYGNLFGSKDHMLLANIMLGSTAPWLLSYNDCDTIRALYSVPGIYIEKIERINNMAQRYDPGSMYQELLISNYDTSLVVPDQLSLTGFAPVERLTIRSQAPK